MSALPEDDPARALARLDDASADRERLGRLRLAAALRGALFVLGGAFVFWLGVGGARYIQGSGALLALLGGPVGMMALFFAQGAEMEEAERLRRVSEMGEPFESLAQELAASCRAARGWSRAASLRGRSLRLFDLRAMQTLSHDLAPGEGEPEPWPWQKKERGKL